jgi:hypothetical protein
MDTGLFQSLALVLLAIIAILLGTVAALVARVRRALEQLNWPAGMTASGAAADTSAGIAVQEQAASSPVQSTQGAAAAEETPSEAGASGSQADSVFRADEGLAEATPEEPQEQPFERDGRWWFRRGDELLVYDEQTGQWLPAPAPTVAASVALGTEGMSSTSAVATETRTSSMTGLSTNSELTSQASSEHSGGFWKCPSCGAVNGSTATSCRMCFSARPA